jgi:AcrR family transcriptional regulator
MTTELQAGPMASAAPGSPSRGEQTRQRIMDAAERCFIHQGYKGASLRAIAAEAGVDTGLISYHFGTKENLFRETVTRCFDEAFQLQLGALARLRAGSALLTVAEVLGAYSDVTINLLAQGDIKLVAAVRLARLRSQPDIDPQLFHYLETCYAPVGEAYCDMLRGLLPGHSAEAVQWGFNAFRFLYANMVNDQFDLIRSQTPAARVKYARRYLVRFCAAGLLALGSES